MVETVPDSDWESIQHFVSNSPWNHHALIDQLCQDANQLLGGSPDSFLMVDESAFSKKGRRSVGVSRQWNGRLGKVDNCQVGVFGALGCGDKVTLSDMRLFLPEEWTKDKERCQNAGVPKEAMTFQSKIDLALDIISKAQKRHMGFQWVGADCFYGRDSHFRQSLVDKGLLYMVDIPKDMIIYLEDPTPCVPAQKSKRGRAPKKLKASTEGFKLEKWVEDQADDAFTKLTIRQGAKGAMKARVLHRIVWIWDGKSQEAEKVHLVVSKRGQKSQHIKYSVSNTPEGTPIERLAYMQAQRYWVERALQNGKSETGMADYQVRGWTAWHHHMAMVMLAMLFMLMTKIKYEKQYKLLSAADIRILLQHFLPKRQISTDEVLRQMEIRHRKRQKDIDLNRKT